MPSRLTRTAGIFAIVAAIAWLVCAPTAFLGVGVEDDWEVRYLTWALLVFAAAACTTVAIFGMLRRAGSGLDAVTVVAMFVAILGTLLLGVATWAWIVGTPLLTIAVIVTVLRLRAARLANTVASILLVAAWPIGIALAFGLGALKVGPIDSYGDRYVAFYIGFATGSVLFAAGLLMMGRWLRSEHAVDVADSMATA